MFACIADGGHCVEHSYCPKADDADQDDLAHCCCRHGWLYLLLLLCLFVVLLIRLFVGE